jgi:methionine-rich copper-binding protein CopC
MVTRALPSLFAIALAIALAGAPPTAYAHAFLEHADPRVGSVIRSAPPVLTLTYTQGVEGPFCRVTVTGPPGFGGAGPPRAVAGDPDTLTVDLKAPAPPGTYVVRWRVLSADTHVTEGDFSFQVKR